MRAISTNFKSAKECHKTDIDKFTNYDNICDKKYCKAVPLFRSGHGRNPCGRERVSFELKVLP